MPTDIAVPTPASTHPRRWTALALICAAQFMLVLDVTVVNVALPSLSADLDLDRTALTWVVTAYTLCFGGLMLLGGRLADALGARRVLLAGLALFTAASLVCGLAASAPVLLGGRVAQGVGAALLSPAALALVTTAFHGAERAKALGAWAAIGGTGSAVGVLLGGALTEGPGWPWVFYVNVPVGLALLAALPKVLPDDHRRPGRTGRTGGRLDAPGALVVTAATGALVYGLVQAGDSGWASAETLLPLLGAVALYGIFVAVERASSAPLMDLRMLRRRPVVAGSLLMLVATALLISFFFLGSMQLQHVYGLGALRTGLLFLPVALTTAIGAHLGARLVTTQGPRACATGGLALAALGCLPLTVLTPGANPWATLLPTLATASFGLGAVFVAATTTALGLITPHEAGLASGIVNTFHEVGGSIGVAAVSTLALTTTTGTGFTTAFTLCTAAAAAAALTAPFLIPRGTPRPTGGPHGVH
ncbi:MULTISPECIES: DHA2 family efflux MFS transporter permease subunit [Streptomyces]|uniref:MFS transporter n=1 Tax=Streptomyces venezuelae TaxID=54571 RepID=A0A5P2ASZ3_STRVZ|nr:DHA2 family efflux MFS transporter permease subunit [Streptomyces venezuelae]QES20937.1 MFS transporter [Streptomyces venezuelae]